MHKKYGKIGVQKIRINDTHRHRYVIAPLNYRFSAFFLFSFFFLFVFSLFFPCLFAVLSLLAGVFVNFQKSWKCENWHLFDREEFRICVKKVSKNLSENYRLRYLQLFVVVLLYMYMYIIAHQHPAQNYWWKLLPPLFEIICYCTCTYYMYTIAHWHPAQNYWWKFSASIICNYLLL